MTSVFGHSAGVLTFCCLVVLSGPLAVQAESPWMAGLARVEITPDEPVRMSGYASRTEPSEGVASPLFAKALAIQDPEGRRGVLVTSDLIGFRASFAEPTCQRIQAETGLNREQLLLNASHTHTGPTLALDAEELDFDGEQAAATMRYTRILQDKVVRLVVESLDRLEPAELSWGVGVAPFVMNRREFTERGVILGVNPRGLVDRSVPVLRIDSPQGQLRAVLFGAACHNTTLTGENRQISGDFAGYSQMHIERALDGVQAMFMQGCAGDANPFPRGSEEIARLHGRVLGEEVLRILEEELASVEGPLTTELTQLEVPLAAPLSRAEIEALTKGRGGWRQFVARRMGELLDEGKELPACYAAPFALWQFGEDLTLVGLPGEVVVDYVTLLEAALGPQRLWIAAYCNDVFGYLPSRQVLEQGGYETRGLYAGGVGFFSPHAQDVVITAIQELARTAGRP